MKKMCVRHTLENVYVSTFRRNLWESLSIKCKYKSFGLHFVYMPIKFYIKIMNAAQKNEGQQSNTDQLPPAPPIQFIIW